MNNHASFNEVFLTEARIPREYVVGQVGEGWRVALTTLAFERRFGGVRRPRYGDAAGRALDQARQEADAHFETYKWYPQRAGRVDLVVDRARAMGRAEIRSCARKSPASSRCSGSAAGRRSGPRRRGPSGGHPGRRALSESWLPVWWPARRRGCTR